LSVNPKCISSWDYAFSLCSSPASDMYTYIDASCDQYLNGKPYVMAVSPWFYTNMPSYVKNWMWRGDDLWMTAGKKS
jgi:hypothetical protein